jgi:hypothetical protein
MATAMEIHEMVRTMPTFRMPILLVGSANVRTFLTVSKHGEVNKTAKRDTAFDASTAARSDVEVSGMNKPMDAPAPP